MLCLNMVIQNFLFLLLSIKVYESISAAGAALGIKQSTISIYFYRHQKSPYKGRFVFTKID